MTAQGWRRDPFGAHAPAREWRYWTIIPPCLLAVLVAVLAMGVGMLSGVLVGLNSDSEGTPGYVPLNGGWIFAGVAGAFIAMLAALAVARSGWPRQVRALTAWGIVLLQAGWLVLARDLAVH